MRLFIKLFLISLLLTQTVSAGFFSDLFNAITNQNKKSEDVRVQEEQTDDLDVAPHREKRVFSSESSDEFDKGDFATKERKIYLSYINYPKRVYLNQHFHIKLQSIIIDENINSLKTELEGGKNFKVINPKPKWKKVDDKTYNATIYFKLLSQDAILPKIKMIAKGENDKLYEDELNSKPLKIIELKKSKLFSNVMADKFDILSHKEKRYDDKRILILMEINATNSNLEDFHLSFASREALDSFEEHLDWQKVYYVCIVPKYQKEFKFKYFNTKKNKFIKVSFPIILADSTLSTQLGLNPKKSKFFIYEVAALFFISLIFFLLYLKYKNKILLFFALFIALYTIFSKLVTSSVTLDKGVNIRILPTHNSTIFFKTPDKIEAKILLKKEGYTKLLLPNGKIGWVRDEDLKKN